MLGGEETGQTFVTIFHYHMLTRLHFDAFYRNDQPDPADLCKDAERSVLASWDDCLQLLCGEDYLRDSSRGSLPQDWMETSNAGRFDHSDGLDGRNLCNR